MPTDLTGLVGNERPLGEKPTFLSAIKSSQESIKLYILLLGLIAGLPFAIELLDEKLKIHNLWISAGISAIPALLILAWLIPKWIYVRNKQNAINLGINGQVKDPKYFRLTPYESDQNFQRADGIQFEVYNWLSKSKAPLLYLSGKSGSGKSSIISGWVIPNIAHKKLPYHVIHARVIADPIPAITQALLKSGTIWSIPPTSNVLNLRELLEECIKKLAPKNLLLVLDQFEEFLILSDEAKQNAFADLLRSLAISPIPGLQVLMILRSDYLGLLHKLNFPPLVQHQNWEEVPPFTERDAMSFLRASGLQITPMLENEIVREAREVEETKGTIRPITINLFGLVLSRFESLPKNYRPGTILRNHLREQIQKKEIWEIAPQIVRSMITDNGTKLPVTLAHIAQTASLDAYQVRGCLVQLGNEGLVRELDVTEGKWEIAHDFIARLYDHILASWRTSVWHRARPWLSGIGIAIWLISVVTLPVLLEDLKENRAVDALSALHFKVGMDGGRRLIEGTQQVTDSDLMKAISHMQILSVEILDLSLTKVGNLEPINGLVNLQSLNLSVSINVENLEPLKGLVNLQSLNLSTTSVKNLEPLKGLANLQSLNLLSTNVENLEPIKDLVNLQSLNLSSTNVENLEPIKDLVNLQSLNLYRTSVVNFAPLEGLVNLKSLNLSRTNIVNCGPLKGLVNLQSLDLSWTNVENLEPLKGLVNLQDLDLSWTNVENLEPLKGLVNLQYLELWWTNVENLEPLKGLANLDLKKLDSKLKAMRKQKDDIGQYN